MNGRTSIGDERRYREGDGGVAAINAENSAREPPVFLICRNPRSLDSFQNMSRISLELLQNTAFPFASRRAVKYR
jgi:hypothetical protein